MKIYFMDGEEISESRALERVSEFTQKPGFVLFVTREAWRNRPLDEAMWEWLSNAPESVLEIATEPTHERE
jgi:hypothetical protein